MRFPSVPMRLDRYIFRQLFWRLIAATAGVTALIWLARRFIELLVNRSLSLVVFIRLTGRLIANFVAVTAPMTACAVIHLIFQRLALDREETVTNPPVRLSEASAWAASA